MADVLIVEDNPSDEELMLFALNKHKVTNSIKIVRDGQEALDYIFHTGFYEAQRTEKTPRVIFLDLNIPKVNGLEVLDQIKSNRKTKHIPIVILSTSSEPRDVTTSYFLGANSYVVKPVDFDKFTSSIKDLCTYWLSLNKMPAGQILSNQDSL
jgi:two-component system, response regulator